MYKLNRGLASDRSDRDLLWSPAPREKLETGDLATLTEVDLIALVLGRGCPGVPVSELAEELSRLIFQVDGKAKIPLFQDFLKVKGLGKAKASALVASLELGKRVATSRGRPIHQPEDALPHLSWLSGCNKERFHALYLDTRRRLLDSQTISIGTLEASLVHPREVFRPALEKSASAILVAHNHPSGDPEPSPEDMALTRRLDKAGRLLGIPLIDHLILAGDDWLSLRRRQMDGETGIDLFAA